MSQFDLEHGLLFAQIASVTTWITLCTLTGRHSPSCGCELGESPADQPPPTLAREMPGETSSGDAPLPPVDHRAEVIEQMALRVLDQLERRKRMATRVGEVATDVADLRRRAQRIRTLAHTLLAQDVAAACPGRERMVRAVKALAASFDPPEPSLSGFEILADESGCAHAVHSELG